MSYILPATLMCDFYKISHRAQYPEKTEYVYSTWTPRSNKHYPNVDAVIAFGFQGFISEFLIEYFDEHFFNRPVSEVIDEYTRYCKHCLFVDNPYYQHIEELHNLSYIPLEIKAVPEGTRVPFRVPMMTIINTDPRFFWFTNYIETLASTELWGPATTATIADRYKQILIKYAGITGNENANKFVQFQGHDFSMRGMSGLYAGMKTGAGHLLSFVGTDSISSIAYLEKYYNANIETELVGCSVPATEHSVQCAGGKDNEFKTYKRLITEVHPTGIISIVSDTWDLWKCLEEIILPLRDIILDRDGQVVIRPDSGDPADILCGTVAKLSNGSPSEKGVVEILFDIFGGTTNHNGFIELDPHIGAIYGDSITPEICEDICKRLMIKGFASTNVVFGIGSYTYQYNTRDTFGFAMKSTMVTIDKKEQMIFKDPATDDGTKKSNTGAVVVLKNKDDELECIDQLSLTYRNDNDLLHTIFYNGLAPSKVSLSKIRQRLESKE